LIVTNRRLRGLSRRRFRKRAVVLCARRRAACRMPSVQVRVVVQRVAPLPRSAELPRSVKSQRFRHGGRVQIGIEYQFTCGGPPDIGGIASNGRVRRFANFPTISCRARLAAQQPRRGACGMPANVVGGLQVRIGHADLALFSKAFNPHGIT